MSDEHRRAGHRIDTARAMPRPFDEPSLMKQQRTDDGWRGTPTAEGTRRRLILDTIHAANPDLLEGPAEEIALADEIEQALIDGSDLPTEVEREVRRLQSEVD